MSDYQTKYCPYPRCVMRVPVTQSCCPIHWKELPKAIRDLAFDMNQETKNGRMTEIERDAKWATVLSQVDEQVRGIRAGVGKPEVFPAEAGKPPMPKDAMAATVAKIFLKCLDEYLKAKAQNLPEKKRLMDELVKQRKNLEKIIEGVLHPPQQQLRLFDNPERTNMPDGGDQ